MNMKKALLVILAVLFLVSCSSNKYGMKKKRWRKCDCPTFSMVLPDTHAERISSGSGC